MELAATLRSLAALADASVRPQSLDVVARTIDARAVVLLVPELDRSTQMTAAPGTAVQLSAWNGCDLVERSASPGVHEGTLTDPQTGRSTSAIAYAHPGLAVVVIGHKQPSAELVSAIATVAPLLASLLRAEQEALVARRRLLVHVGQELREPLAPIATAVQMLRFEGTRTRTQEILERQVARLMRVVDDLVADANAPAQSVTRTTDAEGAVLVVDDNRDAADLLGALLESLGYVVSIAHSGDEALATLDDFTPDIALLDIGLPGMDGYALAHELHARMPSLPLVAITGYGLDKDRARAFEAGFAAHLVKPVAINQLSEILDNLLNRSAVTVRADGNESLPPAPS